MTKRKWKWALLAVLAFVLSSLGVASSIWKFGQQDFAKSSDCIIVLGAAVDGSSPSPVFEERLRHGVTLYQQGLASKLILTGGKGDGERFSEGEVGAKYALAMGVPTGAVLKETLSRTTRENLLEAHKVMQTQGLQSAVIVSDPLHLKRAACMAKGMGLEAVTSPTPTTRYQSFRTQFGFLAREVYFVHHYWVFRK